MFYIYYNNEGTILAVVNMIDESFGPNYIETDLKTYEDFSNGTKQFFDYSIVENFKIKGKMQLLANNIETLDEQLQPKGIINKSNIEDNAIILIQNKNKGTWSIKSTMNDEICALFAQGEDHIKHYYVVDPTNRFILYDTLSVNLKMLALNNTVELTNYNISKCKKDVSLLCTSHYVKHIHTVEE